MSLKIDFSGLHLAVSQMGAAGHKTDFALDLPYEPIDEIDVQLDDGMEVKLEEVDTTGGLLSYRGRQILLYIQDHGFNPQVVIEDGSRGNKFHVSDCVTLEEMRRKKRFERYVVTNNLSGNFFITGIDPVNRLQVKGYAQLKVCKNCLGMLNYKNYRYGNRGEVFAEFTIKEFFSVYSSFFPYRPKRMAGDMDGVYTPDWPEVSSRLKRQRNFRCESCGVDLSSKPNLLNTHHVNGVKTDNRESNLQVLCIDCHRKQPHHDLIHVNHEATQAINHLRRAQGKMIDAGWKDVFELIDPAMLSVAKHLHQNRKSTPEVGYELQDRTQAVVAQLELAWPSRRIGIAIKQEDLVAAKNLGWKAYTMIEALEKL